MEMTIQDIGSIGELVVAVATIVTLGYLAVQIRHSAKLITLSNSSSLREAYSDFTRILATDREACRVWWEGCESRAALAEADRRQFDALLALVILTWQHQFELGLDPDNLRMWEFTLRTQGFKDWWSEYREFNNSDRFRAMIDRRTRELESTA